MAEDVATRRFREKLGSFMIIPELDKKLDCRRPAFLRIRELKRWLTTPDDSSRRSSRTPLEDLLDEAYANHSNHKFELKKFDEIVDKWILTFCILLQIDQGHLLHIFQQELNNNDVGVDSQLPIGKETLMNGLRDREIPDVENVINNFYDTQESYSVVGLTLGMSHNSCFNNVMPIVSREPISEGATAIIHCLCIPEEFVDERLHDVLKPYAVNKLGIRCFQVAAKTFGHHQRERFRHEVQVYKALKDVVGMVKFLGTYTHKDGKVRTHNIILEFAECDLAERFKHTDPPVLPENVYDFWKKLWEVANTLSKLHKFTRSGKGKDEKFWGWHADIKPDNILQIQGILKLADPGFADFTMLVDDKVPVNQTIISMGTSYAAPECFIRSGAIREPHAADMWSFGCVLSEAVTWMVEGPAGVTKYRAIRESAAANKDNSIGGLHRFHDGHKLLDEVMAWHRHLLQVRRVSDNTTETILALIEKHLLQSVPSDRTTAKDFDELFSHIPKPNHFQMPFQIKDVIDRAETKLRFVDLPEATISIKERKALKSRDPRVLSMAPLRIETDLKIKASQSLLVESPSTEPHQQNFSLPQSNILVPEATIASEVPVAKDDNFCDVYMARSKRESVNTTSVRNKLTRLVRFGTEMDKYLGFKYGKERDIHILIDNSGDMLSVWERLEFLTVELILMAANVDKDGIDVTFTNSAEQKTFSRSASERDISSWLAQQKPQKRDHAEMCDQLGRLLDDWLNEHKMFVKPKAKTILVLTDGRWVHHSPEGQLEKRIVQWHRAYEKKNTLSDDRRLSIEFVTFGQDAPALDYMQYLDDNFAKKHGIPDFIDTAPWYGNMYQIYLGSFDGKWDERNDASAVTMMKEQVSAVGQSGPFTADLHCTTSNPGTYRHTLPLPTSVLRSQRPSAPPIESMFTESYSSRYPPHQVIRRSEEQ